MSHAQRNSLSLLSFALCFFIPGGCSWEKATTVRIEPGPSFRFSGSGRLAALTVSAPVSGQRIAFPCGKLLFPCSARLASIVWQIDSSSGTTGGSHLEGLKVILGKVPEGYVQTIPRRSTEVPVFPPGVIYAYSAETWNAEGRGGYFYMNGSGAAVPVDVPELCATLREGVQVRVNCVTKEPFQEPKDLEGFVTSHQKN